LGVHLAHFLRAILPRVPRGGFEARQRRRQVLLTSKQPAGERNGRDRRAVFQTLDVKMPSVARATIIVTDICCSALTEGLHPMLRGAAFIGSLYCSKEEPVSKLLNSILAPVSIVGRFRRVAEIGVLGARDHRR